MKTPAMFTKACVLAALVFTNTASAYAFNFNYADPDFIASQYEYSGTPAVKIGEFIRFGNLCISGFLEARNEKRFHQEALPNHNWRGFGSITYSYAFAESPACAVYAETGYEHESAHSTMGMRRSTNDAYEMIYDDQYRNINLNSVPVVFNFSYSPNSSITIRAKAGYRFYFQSENSPELSNNDRTYSHGLSGGIECICAVTAGMQAYISLYDRYIFEGRRMSRDMVYYNENNAVVARYTRYPIINDVNTIACRAGLLVAGTGWSHTINIYGRMLYGNIYGLVDSRERRLVFAAGVEIMR